MGNGGLEIVREDGRKLDCHVHTTISHSFNPESLKMAIVTQKGSMKE